MGYLEHSEHSAALQARANTSLDRTLRNFRAAKYPQYAVYLVACLVVVVSLYNVTYILYTRLTLNSFLRSKISGSAEGKDKETGPESVRRRGDISLRRVPLAMLNTLRIAAYRVSLPLGPGLRVPLIEVVTCAGYFLAMLTLEFANSRNTAGLLDPQYWADRAGTLAVSQISFIIALSGKNNIISTLTGISYEKLNILHRAASRMLLLLIWVHMWGRASTLFTIWELGLTGKDSLHVGWIRSGIVANVALTLMIILGTRQLRNWGYELFLAGHIVLSVILLVAACIHVTNAEQFLPYIWPACIVWGLDRVLRLVRTLRIRYLASRCKGTASQAILEVLSPDTVRLSIRVARSSHLLLRFGWQAGQNAYLSVPTVARWGWGLSTEAHPFTIASIDVPVESLRRSDIIDEAHGSQEKQEKETELEMKFIIRVRRGFTRRLYEHAVRAGGVCSVSVFVDGPYGEPPVVHDHSNVVLLAGGSGVSFTLPLLLDLIRRARKETPNTLCRKIDFIWFIREQAHFDGISDDLSAIQESLPAELDVNIRVFVTGKLDPRAELDVPSLNSSAQKGTGAETPVASTEPSAAVSKEKLESESPITEDDKPGSSAEVTTNSLVRLVYGRPAVVGILEDEVAACEDSVAICVSGPQTLIDDVRDALSKPRIAGPMAVLRGGANVFLHVERFGM